MLGGGNGIEGAVVVVVVAVVGGGVELLGVIPRPVGAGLAGIGGEIFVVVVVEGGVVG